MTPDLIETKGFTGLSSSELELYAHRKDSELGLGVADAYFPGVLENLAALQSHAAILAACLQADADEPRRLGS